MVTSMEIFMDFFFFSYFDRAKAWKADIANPTSCCHNAKPLQFIILILQSFQNFLFIHQFHWA